MKQSVRNHYDLLLQRYPALEAQGAHILSMFEIMAETYYAGGKLLVCGNGGSCADSEHIVGELMKSFCMPRPISAELREALLLVDAEMGELLAENLQGALPAIALDGHPALSTAFLNDVEPTLTFAQQVNGYGVAGDVLLGITTSGNSKNVLYAAALAKAKGMQVVGLTGERESKLSMIADACVRVPERETYKVQELHLPIYHCLCLMIEDAFFGSK